jgi:hypothetical protein
MHLTETTHGKLAEALATLKTLAAWAEADAASASENNAPGLARDDMRRARKLRKAIDLVLACER